MRGEQVCLVAKRRIGSDGNRAPDDSSGADGPAFPAARYFQVHFEYLEELLGEMNSRLESLRSEVAALQRDSAAAPGPAAKRRKVLRPVGSAAER
jgi:hypothetical protein